MSWFLQNPMSGALVKHQRGAAPDLPSRSVSFCCVPFEGSFAKLSGKGTFFCSHCLNANMNKCESHQMRCPSRPQVNPAHSPLWSLPQKRFLAPVTPLISQDIL